MSAWWKKLHELSSASEFKVFKKLYVKSTLISCYFQRESEEHIFNDILLSHEAMGEDLWMAVKYLSDVGNLCSTTHIYTTSF